ncbi:hypothetical protein Tco_0446431 [Tanacetum coccineum]
MDDVQETAEVDDDQEAVKIKELMEINPDEEEVAIDVITLAAKPPSIVDWKIHKEGKKSYYQIIGKRLLGLRGRSCGGSGWIGGFMAGRGGRFSRESKNACGEVGGDEKMSSTRSKFMVRGEECLEGCVGGRSTGLGEGNLIRTKWIHGVDFSNMEMIEDDWELEPKQVSFLGRRLNCQSRANKNVENVRMKKTQHHLEQSIQQLFLQHGGATPLLITIGRKAYLLEDKQIPSVRVFDEVIWMAFGGNTRELGSFGEETNAITDLYQILEEVLLTERGDGVACIKRRRRDPSSDGVKDLLTTSGRRPLNKDLESST